jgi:plastocyanin
MDLTGMAATSIAFGGANGLVFVPKCIKVSVGTTVTFNGNLATHPLQAGEVVAGVENPASSGTPLPTSPLNTGATSDFVMSSAGTFPYYCVPHGTIGMNGAIFVVP